MVQPQFPGGNPYVPIQGVLAMRQPQFPGGNINPSLPNNQGHIVMVQPQFPAWHNPSIPCQRGVAMALQPQFPLRNPSVPNQKRNSYGKISITTTESTKVAVVAA